MSANSYRKILESTALVGAVQLFKILFELAKGKALALLVGTAGFGAYSLYNTLRTTVAAFAALGVDQAGVKEIAVAARQPRALSELLWVYRAVLVIGSSTVSLVMYVLREKVSLLLFGVGDHSTGVALVALAIFFGAVAQGYVAILSGLRRLADLAMSQVLGALVGAVSAVMIVYLMREDGIPWFILVALVGAFLVAQYYYRRLHVEVTRPPLARAGSIAVRLMREGMALAYGAVIVALSTIFCQIFVRSTYGMETVGHYNASLLIANSYVGVVLSAIGVDFLPRVARVARDRVKLNQLLNEEMELCFLISVVGFVVTAAFAPVMLRVIYTPAFVDAATIVKWQVLGIVVRVVAFPLTYVLIARGESAKYMLIQTSLWGGLVLWLMLLTTTVGRSVLGLEYPVSYVTYLVVLLIGARSYFRPSRNLVAIVLQSGAFIVPSWMLTCVNDGLVRVALGGVISVATVAWAIGVMKYRLGLDPWKLLIRNGRNK